MIQDILVSDELLTEQFVCRLEACKGACCWEGDWGAPLEAEERATLDRIWPLVAPYLPEASRRQLEEEGRYTFYPEPGEYGTPLRPNGACVYMTTDEEGVAHCGIEQAYRAGAVDFRKPISCHLYPVRVKQNRALGFEALNYDRWDICSAACSHGRSLQMPLYRFVREALIRKYGQDFYDELAAAAGYWQRQREEGSDQP